jgi:hypothetical protein
VLLLHSRKLLLLLLLQLLLFCQPARNCKRKLCESADTAAAAGYYC